MAANRTASENHKRYKELKAQATELELVLTEMGIPQSSWSDDQLEQFVQISKQLEANYAERVAIMNSPYPGVEHLDRERVSVAENQKTVTGRLQIVDYVKMAKAAEPQISEDVEVDVDVVESVE